MVVKVVRSLWQWFVESFDKKYFIEHLTPYSLLEHITETYRASHKLNLKDFRPDGHMGTSEINICDFINITLAGLGGLLLASILMFVIGFMIMSLTFIPFVPVLNNSYTFDSMLILSHAFIFVVIVVMILFTIIEQWSNYRERTYYERRNKKNKKKNGILHLIGQSIYSVSNKVCFKIDLSKYR